MKILIIDRDRALAQELEDKLVAAGHEVEAPDSLKECLKLASLFDPHLIITDFDLGTSITGADMCRFIRLASKEAAVLVLSDTPYAESKAAFKKLTPLAWFTKSHDSSELINYVQDLQSSLENRPRNMGGLREKLFSALLHCNSLDQILGNRNYRKPRRSANGAF